MERFWRELFELLEKHGRVSASSSKTISIATVHMRRDYLRRELSRLRTGGLIHEADGKQVNVPPFKIKSIYNLKPKHIRALVADWTARQLSVAYVHNLLSMFRLLCGWIGKTGMVPPIEDLTSDPRYHRRVLVATRDATWSSCGINPHEKIAEITKKDPRAAMVLELMLAFRLRLKEACLLRPWLADQGLYLDIKRGTKGGRDRTHGINDIEREVLDRAKSLVDDRNACLVPRGQTYRAYQNHMYYVLRREGITTAECGTSSHGLRREGLNQDYQRITGATSPVKGGQPGDVDPELDRYARQQVAEIAGHCRVQIASAYLGGMQRHKANDRIPQTRRMGNERH